MSATADMRDLARQLFTVAVNAADPGCTVRRHFKSCPPAAPSAGGHYIVLAIGKAAPAMLRETLEHLRHPVTAFGVTHRPGRRDSRQLQYSPDARSWCRSRSPTLQ
tara:strand:+ start:9145 stop:9462 length:318 start_codon:yes stop_codon:yes gene_type:complete